MRNPYFLPLCLEISLRFCPREIFQVSGNLSGIEDALVLVEHRYSLSHSLILASFFSPELYHEDDFGVEIEILYYIIKKDQF